MSLFLRRKTASDDLDIWEVFANKSGRNLEIITIKDILVHGANLGNLSAKLLLKIDEFTLYMIDQQMRINAQSGEIMALKCLEVRLSLLEKKQ